MKFWTKIKEAIFGKHVPEECDHCTVEEDPNLLKILNLALDLKQGESIEGHTDAQGNWVVTKHSKEKK